MKARLISRNSFDLVRLFAAMQVAFLHSVEFMSPHHITSFWFRILENFPGVPIFFFISGFLISRSYENNNSIKEYGVNRALRIFPALHICVLLNILLVAATGYMTHVHVGYGDIFLLYLAKTTIFQFYNPDFMRGFGDGVLNGSLWTICVELQFYILLPLLYKVMDGRTKKDANIILMCTIIIFLLFNRLLYHYQGDYANTIYWKLIRVSFFPWFYMFLVGVFFQRNFDFFWSISTRVSLITLLIIYFGYASLMRAAGLTVDNSIGPFLYFPLAFIVFRISFSMLTEVAELLNKNDVSYGIYIYHMPIANVFIYYGLINSMIYPLLVLLLSILISLFSWFLIEKPCLRLKRHPLNPVGI
ncbi:MAG TPA: acyltransferase [Candidatus Competibacter sp.]|nr:acyltransferase [Candidatus Competibacter sp.]